jgi:RNA polymerase sigma factor (sigma-70 family)
MRKAKGTELGAIEAIYRSRLRELQRLATAITGSRELGCDAVQDAFARAVHRRSEFRGDGSLDGWMWQIVVSCAHDVRRRRRQADELPPDGPGSAAAPEDADDVRDAVSQLPERQRLALFLRYYADLDYGTIAQVLEIAPGTVAATLHKAHANVRQLMTEVSR